MNRNLYSNADFTKLKEELNEEIKRRGTFSWWDPLVPPTVGQDRTPPLTLPDIGQRMAVSDGTYTINNPSELALERTRNINYPAQGHNPGGELPNTILVNKINKLRTSAARWDVDEVKNFLVGLAKIQDINLFYGRDELPGTAFRDPQGIVEALENAKNSELNALLHESDISPSKIDYHTGNLVTPPQEDGIYVMPSGETDGDEVEKLHGPDESNFYDDHGAEITDTGMVTHDGQPILISDSNYHPVNPYITPVVNRDWNDQTRTRDRVTTTVEEGGLPSARFGPNPRNPNPGNPYQSRPIFGGVIGACNVACTGLCYLTCDNECSESCTSTCWSRCGNACTASCGNICTGCSTMCYTSCKTKCQDITGYACLHAGARTVNIVPVGRPTGSSGEPGSSTWPKNTLSYTTYACNGCAYTCQFYPNKRTTCWDAACQELCFTSCMRACSTSCFGGCIDNKDENSSWRTGIGRACSNGCTINCVGSCFGVCQRYCISTCFHACKTQCYDNCTWRCWTSCGSGCENGCRNGCMGCHNTCSGSCMGEQDLRSQTCWGCGSAGGCLSTCRHACNKNCIGWGCRSICGIESAGACEANCRLNCTGQNCTSMCSDACSSVCTTCANNCGHNCGPCTATCSIGCGAACNITCTERCQNACDNYCYNSCVESCGGCSDLCYSCVGMCIGVCSVRCESTCSSCTNQCGWWCDSACNRQCFSNCDTRCISTCSGSCATYLESESTSIYFVRDKFVVTDVNVDTDAFTSEGGTANVEVEMEYSKSERKILPGAERPPTAIGYHTPNPSNRYEERESFRFKSFDHSVLPIIPEPEKEYLIKVYFETDVREVVSGESSDPVLKMDPNMIVEAPGFKWIWRSAVSIGGVWSIYQDTGEIVVVEPAMASVLEFMYPHVDDGRAIFYVVVYNNPDIPVDIDNDIFVVDPRRIEHAILKDSDDNIIVVFQREFFGPFETIMDENGNYTFIKGERYGNDIKDSL